MAAYIAAPDCRKMQQQRCDPAVLQACARSGLDAVPPYVWLAAGPESLHLNSWKISGPMHS